jgi:hypothetical protein
MPTLSSPFVPATLLTRLASRLARAEAADRVFVTVPVATVRALLPLAARSLPLSTEAIPGLTEVLGPVQAARCYREIAAAALAKADATILDALAVAAQLAPAERPGYLQARFAGGRRAVTATGGAR